MPDRIREVVDLILNGNTEPAWLDGRLREKSRMIRSYIEAEDRAPKRVELRKQLDIFRNAAAQVLEGLNDPLLMTFIGNDWADIPLSHNEIKRTLEHLGNRASSVSMASAGRGGGRAFPTETDDSLSAQQLCMWTVMTALRKTTAAPTQDDEINLAISMDDKTAWSAANALWQTSGGMALGLTETDTRDARDPSGWRKHIVAVQALEEAGGRVAKGLAFMEQAFEAICVVPISEIAER